MLYIEKKGGEIRWPIRKHRSALELLPQKFCVIPMLRKKLKVQQDHH